MNEHVIAALQHRIDLYDSDPWYHGYSSTYTTVIRDMTRARINMERFYQKNPKLTPPSQLIYPQCCYRVLSI